LTGLFTRGFSKGVGAVLAKSHKLWFRQNGFGTYFLIKNGFSKKKTFGRAFLEESEPESKKSSAKEALNYI
jgi:hypothetical protein